MRSEGNNVQIAEGTYVQKETKFKRKENSEGSKVFIKK